jgi:hypothetical protein
VQTVAPTSVKMARTLAGPARQAIHNDRIEANAVVMSKRPPQLRAISRTVLSMTGLVEVEGPDSASHVSSMQPKNFKPALRVCSTVIVC